MKVIGYVKLGDGTDTFSPVDEGNERIFISN